MWHDIGIWWVSQDEKIFVYCTTTSDTKVTFHRHEGFGIVNIDINNTNKYISCIHVPYLFEKNVESPNGIIKGDTNPALVMTLNLHGCHKCLATCEACTWTVLHSIWWWTPTQVQAKTMCLQRWRTRIFASTWPTPRVALPNTLASTWHNNQNLRSRSLSCGHPFWYNAFSCYKPIRLIIMSGP